MILSKTGRKVLHMKKKIKNLLKKLPGVKKVWWKLDALEQQTAALTEENRNLARQVIDLRLKLKKMNHEPIHAVFVCHRPAVWESLHSVYDAMKADPDFKVTIVAIPNKKQLPGLGFNHEVYESEGAEEFWKEEGCIRGYNYETGEWLDLKSIEPDYVFFQAPYNICRSPQYRSDAVSKYAKICFIAYYGLLYTNSIYDECAPFDYLRDLSFFFTQHSMDYEHIKKRMDTIAPHNCKIVNTGFPRYDRLEQYKAQPCDIWKNPESFKIVWTPRWTTNEGNCYFFAFKDLLLDYCRQDSYIELVFRPHPQAFLEWEATGELPKAAAEEYKKNFDGNQLHLDLSNNYYPTIHTSDCLVTDRSSMLLDYYCTGKPIIFCQGHSEHDHVFPQLLEGMYVADNWQTVESILTKLRNGIDPLMPVRQRVIKEFFIRDGQSACKNIIDAIKADV